MDAALGPATKRPVAGPSPAPGGEARGARTGCAGPPPAARPGAPAGGGVLAAGAGRGPGDFGPALLRAGARHLAGERDALADFARRHFPGLGGPRDQAAAALALEHAVCSWLPALPAAEAEVRVRAAVRGALARAVRLEEHWQARTMSTLLPAGDAQAAFDQAEGRVDAERLIAMAQVPPAERALLRALARGDGGWSAVRRCLPADLRTTDEAFYRWQRAARQRWQRALARIVRP